MYDEDHNYAKWYKVGLGADLCNFDTSSFILKKFLFFKVFLKA